MFKYHLASKQAGYVPLLLLAGLCGSSSSSLASTQPITFKAPVAVILPLIVGWYNGEPAPYISTEASDQAIAKTMHANYVPRLTYAAGTKAVDSIYLITNFKQGNVIASRPKPAGPYNRDPNYSPLWRANMVTWNSNVAPYLLTSEKAVLDVVQKGEAKLKTTNIVINCPVIFTPTGGLLPRATLLNHYDPGVTDPTASGE